MKIEHLAIWVENLERSREFYEKYFFMLSGDKYTNPHKEFESYFLRFDDESKTRIELMKKTGVSTNSNTRGMLLGYAHIAISVGSKSNVDHLTNRLKIDGYKIIGQPRTTGDGYYESVIEDNEGNWIEITV